MDDTSLKAALVMAIGHSDQPMVLTDPALPDNPMIVINPAFEAMTGYGTELLGHNCRILQGPQTDLATAHRIGRTLQEGQGCIEWIVNHRPDGRAFWNLLFVTPVRGADGKPRFFLGNQLDMTMGTPEWLGEVVFGRAHMTESVEHEFQGLLATMLAHPNRPGALTQAVAHARRLAEVTTSLSSGRSVPAL